MLKEIYSVTKLTPHTLTVSVHGLRHFCASRATPYDARPENKPQET